MSSTPPPKSNLPTPDTKATDTSPYHKVRRIRQRSSRIDTRSSSTGKLRKLRTLESVPASSRASLGSTYTGDHPTSATSFGLRGPVASETMTFSEQQGQNIAQYGNAGYWLQICYFTGLSNMVLQGGFKAAGTLEATINGDLAFLGNAILYAIFACGCLLMPPMIRWFELRSQIKFIAFVGGFGYTFYLYVNTTTPSEDPGAASWVIYLIGSTMVGLGAPLVWIPTLEMVGRSAYFHVRDMSRPTSPAGGAEVALFNRTNENGERQEVGNERSGLQADRRRHQRGSILSSAGGDSPNTSFYRRLDRNLSRFNGIFFAIFQLHGLVLYPLGVIVANSDDSTDWRQPLFWTVAMLPLAASFVFLMIPPIPKSDLIPGTPPPDVRLWKSIKFIFAEKIFRRLAPSIIVNGMVLGFLFGDFGKFFVSPTLGVDSVLIVNASFFCACAIATVAWAKLIVWNKISRRTVILISMVTQCCFLVLHITLYTTKTAIGTNYIQDPNDPTSWKMVEKPQAYHYTIIISSVILLAIGDSAYESQLPAAVQNAYQSTPLHITANANYKAAQSWGFLLQFAIDVIFEKVGGVNPVVPASIVLALLLISYIPLRSSEALCCDITSLTNIQPSGRRISDRRRSSSCSMPSAVGDRRSSLGSLEVIEEPHLSEEHDRSAAGTGSMGRQSNGRRSSVPFVNSSSFLDSSLINTQYRYELDRCAA